MTSMVFRAAADVGRRLALGLVAVAIAVGCLMAMTAGRPPAEAANAPTERADAGERDFGETVIVFSLEYEDDLVPAVPWAFTRARVQRLGNVFFLTGVVPEAVDAEAPRHWIPLADIVRMTEFGTLESARRAIDESSGTIEQERPVLHRAGRRSPQRDR